ncbi:MAG: non-heme iron oxygenase ferredoxin subunit [Chloroflexi bacterium]|nr:non-heme iron oxygenase ferredoxin subunit [Chloroflexota bacterium]
MARWVALCPSDELQDGQREVFGVDGVWIAVFNVGGRVYAIEDLCTHDGNVLAFDRNDRPSPLVGHEIECPRHGGRFDIRNGKATRSPAEIDVRWFETRIEENLVQVQVDA